MLHLNHLLFDFSNIHLFVPLNRFELVLFFYFLLNDVLNIKSRAFQLFFQVSDYRLMLFYFLMESLIVML